MSTGSYKIRETVQFFSLYFEQDTQKNEGNDKQLLKNVNSSLFVGSTMMSLKCFLCSINPICMLFLLFLPYGFYSMRALRNVPEVK